MIMYWLLRIGFALSRRLPLSWRYALGAVGGEAVYWCWLAKRRNTRRNMAVVTGEHRESRRTAAMARASLRNYGRYVIDFLNLPNMPPAEVVRRARVQGWEHVDRGLEAGNGVIFVTGHFGFWDYAPCLAAARYPGRVYVVAEAFTSPRVDRLIQSQREAQGTTVIPMTCVRQMVRVLRNNGILGVLVDRPADGDGIAVQFFGRRTTVPAGAATLAAITGAALVPGYLIRRRDGGYEGYILPPTTPAPGVDRAADIQRMTQSIFSALERIIAGSPQYWYMFRDMWPARPLPDPGQDLGSGSRAERGMWAAPPGPRVSGETRGESAGALA
jgi:KDO2-lipid IV(A) lauroyltransferase